MTLPIPGGLASMQSSPLPGALGQEWNNFWWNTLLCTAPDIALAVEVSLERRSVATWLVAKATAVYLALGVAGPPQSPLLFTWTYSSCHLSGVL